MLNRQSSLRYRLLTLVLVPLILLSGTVVLLAFKWSSDYTYEQLFAKVNTDLRVASDSFSSIEARGRQQLQAFANSLQLSRALSSNDIDRLLELMAVESELGEFDFLTLLSGNAQSRLSREGWLPYAFRDSSLSHQLLSARSPATFSGVEVYAAEQWQQKPGLSASAIVLPLLDTERAAPSTRLSENRAMVIRTLQSVYDEAGNRVAVLEAGLLLNRNYAFVDRIRDLVYGPGSLAEGSRGTVTVFLDDVRISTNVPMGRTLRAVGTRVSQEVMSAVLERGETWVDRAFVVNDWYISAYEPITNVSGERIGMLYTGYLEAPYRAALFKAIAVLSMVVLAGSLAAALAAIVGARAIFKPIESITSVVRATARGEHRRIGPMPTGDEIGELAYQFDTMLDTVDSNRQRIERDALQLEEKVRQRTLELSEQNRRLQDSIELLQQTRRELATAEKLAALGELTAGVAHEINNPTAVILGNMDVLVADLGEQGKAFQTEIDLIIEQVDRIRSITERLLQYSRSVNVSHLPDSKLSASSVPLGELIDDTLRLLSHELQGRQIKVSTLDSADRAALIDRQEFQQVLINLISNAIAAIVNNGEITIETCNKGNNEISLQVADNGRGIEAAHIPRVFDPFFTAGKVQGTGLGLSVSYGIVRRYKGDISVSSSLGKGSLFSVTLPAV